MKILGIIPARYASSRFPGKALTNIYGKPMIQHVYERVRTSKELDDIIVATDDKRIFDVVQAFGGNAMMTSTQHKNGTERCAEVLRNIETGYDIIVNIQGDEPLFHATSIKHLANCFSNQNTDIATLVRQIHSDKNELFNDSVIKVVFDNNNNALYFSRSALPFVRDEPREKWLTNQKFYKHIGIYAYRSSCLLSLVELSSGKLETAEKLEQLRWMEHGYRIQVALTESDSISIDTPEDLDFLLTNYKSELEYEHK